MADIMEQISHAADVAKWKVEQQANILKKQNEVSKIQTDIRKLKKELGEAAYESHKEEPLTNKNLVAICNKITKMDKSISSIEKEIEALKNEKPPEIMETEVKESSPKKEKPAKLVCPECGKAIPKGGNFCPVHGKKGIPAE